MNMTDLHHSSNGFTSVNWTSHPRHNNTTGEVVASSDSSQSHFRQLPPIIHSESQQTESLWASSRSVSGDTLTFTSASSKPSTPPLLPLGHVITKKPRTPLITKEIHVEKNTEGKPPYSYATLIKYAIENSSQKKLTLNEVYQWVIEHYPYYATAGNGWKNSIRHNLSLNKSFVRVARPINEPGKGSYWTVDHYAAESEHRARQALRTRASRSGSDPAPSPYRPEPNTSSWGRRRYRDARSLSADTGYAAPSISADSACGVVNPQYHQSFDRPTTSWYRQQQQQQHSRHYGTDPRQALYAFGYSAGTDLNAAVPPTQSYDVYNMHSYYHHPMNRSADPGALAASAGAVSASHLPVTHSTTDAYNPVYPTYQEDSFRKAAQPTYSQQQSYSHSSASMLPLMSSPPTASTTASVWPSQDMAACHSSETSSNLSLPSDSLASPQPQHFQDSSCLPLHKIPSPSSPSSPGQTFTTSATGPNHTEMCYNASIPSSPGGHNSSPHMLRKQARSPIRKPYSPRSDDPFDKRADILYV